MTNGHVGNTWERIALGVFGVAFLLIMLGIAIFLPEVTPFQVFVFRTVLAIVAAAAAAFIPGFIRADLGLGTRLTIRAGGAIAVFAVVFLVNPPLLVSAPKKFVHEGLVGALTDHINSKVTDFSLTLAPERGDELRSLYIKETIGNSWQDLFSKICARYASCLKCTPAVGQISDSVQLELVGPPLQSDPQVSSGSVKLCPGT